MKWSTLLAPVLVVSGMAAEPVELRVDRVPIRPPEAEVRELLSVVCPGKVDGYRDNKSLPEEVNAASRGFFGCQSCPDFTNPPLNSAWQAEAIHYGHFTAADADEAAVATGGCESHVDQWGGTVLFARSGGTWHMKWYQASLITSDCLQVRRRDGRDMLVCEDNDAHQAVLTHILSVVDLSRHERFRQDGILRLTENPETCGANWTVADDNTIYPVQVANFRRIAFVAEPRPRLEISVEYGWRVLAAAEQSACLAAVRKPQPTPAALRPATKTYHLEFGFDGERFELRDQDVAASKLVETYPPVR